MDFGSIDWPDVESASSAAAYHLGFGFNGDSILRSSPASDFGFAEIDLPPRNREDDPADLNRASAETPTPQQTGTKPSVCSLPSDHPSAYLQNTAPGSENLGGDRSSAAIPPTTDFEAFQSPSLAKDAKDQEYQALFRRREHARTPASNSWLLKIVDVNIKLFENAATFPPSHITGRQDGPEDLVNKLETKDFAIDTTFQLSKELIDILSEIRPGPRKYPQPYTTPRSDVARSLLDHNSTSGAATLFSSRIEDEDASNGKTTICSLDAGSNLLIFSCYIRILDIYAKFFAQLKALISNTNGQGVLHSLNLPSLNIGTFSLQSSPSLQITLFIRLVEEVMERLRNVVCQTDSCCASQWSKDDDGDQVHDSVFNGVSQATLQAIRVSESKIAKSMNELRRKLQHLQSL